MKAQLVSIKFTIGFKHAIFFAIFTGREERETVVQLLGEKQKMGKRGGGRSIITKVGASDSEDPHGREDKDVADSEQEVGQSLEDPVVHALSLGLGINGVLEPIIPSIRVNQFEQNNEKLKTVTFHFMGA